MVRNQLMQAFAEHGIKRVDPYYCCFRQMHSWSLSEYAAKAKAKDEEEKEIMQQKEEQMRKGMFSV
jgi:hypothetical protein